MVLHIFFRQTGDRLHKSHLSLRPQWFDYKKCFYNFVNTLRPATFKYDIKFNIIFDGDLTGTFTEDYLNNPTFPINLIQIKSEGEAQSGHIMWKYIKSEYEYDDKDIIYIVENDYVHVPGWVDVLMGLYESFDASYASLYDHNDKYFLPMYDDLESPIIYTNHCHWRGVPSTTGTFAVKGAWLREDIDQHLDIKGDFHKFKSLVETKAASVYTPMPGYSTHCMNDLLSPLVDWEKVLAETTR